MANLDFISLPKALPGPSPYFDLNLLFTVDGPLSATASRIEAVNTYFSYDYYYYIPHSQSIDVEIVGRFVYGPLGTVSGTLTGITLSEDGTPFATLTAADIDAGEAWVAMLGSQTPLTTLLAGDDIITGSDSSDSLRGYTGRDTISGGGGYDYIWGGLGRDTLNGGDDGDTLRGGGDKDVLIGNRGGDWLYGGNGDDALLGSNGRDLLHGDAGDDRLYGGLGNDRIYGDGGNDTMSGGAGDDSFVFSFFGRAGKSGQDIIVDFEATDEILLGRLGRDGVITVTQTGDDVTIAMADTTIDSLITVLDATAAEVTAAIETSVWQYY